MQRSRAPRIAVVVAHPDDEALWFSSVLNTAAAIVFCYAAVSSRPDWTRGRQAALEGYPLPAVQSLGLTESEALSGADWNDPQEREYGLDVRRRSDTLPGADFDRYVDNYPLLVSALRERLKGFDRVYTHNPWGEYGHEEHVQVYRAVRALRNELGFELWFGNYCSNKSQRLMLRYIGGFSSRYDVCETDAALGERLAVHYRANGCWTWFDDYRWFTHECFMSDAALPTPKPMGHMFPLNYIKIPEPAPEPSRAARAAGTLRSALAEIKRVAGAGASGR